MGRIMRRSKMHQKNFSVKQYGGWGAATKAAKVWVKEMLQVLPKPVMTPKNRMTKRNQSGVVGVHAAPSVIRKQSGKEYTYWRWIARWPGCKPRSGIGWSVNTLGDDDAFVLAVLSRRLESTDRKRIRAHLARINGKKAHSAILALKVKQRMSKR